MKNDTNHTVVLIGRPTSGKASILRALAKSSAAVHLDVKRADSEHRGVPVKLSLNHLAHAERQDPNVSWLRKIIRWPLRNFVGSESKLQQKLNLLAVQRANLNIRTNSSHIFYWREQLREDLRIADELIWVLDVQPTLGTSDEQFLVAKKWWSEFFAECKEIDDSLGGRLKRVSWLLVVSKVDLIPDGLTLSPRLVGWPIDGPLPERRVEVSAATGQGLCRFVSTIGDLPSGSSFRDLVDQTLKGASSG